MVGNQEQRAATVVSGASEVVLAASVVVLQAWQVHGQHLRIASLYWDLDREMLGRKWGEVRRGEAR